MAAAGGGVRARDRSGSGRGRPDSGRGFYRRGGTGPPPLGSRGAERQPMGPSEGGEGAPAGSPLPCVRPGSPVTFGAGQALSGLPGAGSAQPGGWQRRGVGRGDPPRVGRGAQRRAQSRGRGRVGLGGPPGARGKGSGAPRPGTGRARGLRGRSSPGAGGEGPCAGSRRVGGARRKGHRDWRRGVGGAAPSEGEGGAYWGGGRDHPVAGGGARRRAQGQRAEGSRGGDPPGLEERDSGCYAQARERAQGVLPVAGGGARRLTHGQGVGGRGAGTRRELEKKEEARGGARCPGGAGRPGDREGREGPPVGRREGDTKKAEIGARGGARRGVPGLGPPSPAPSLLRGDRSGSGRFRPASGLPSGDLRLGRRLPAGAGVGGRRTLGTGRGG
ncbi:spidroin-1-like [Choloepus didactylus]|uniref:spidroin-1-like n=1 Tax=Choloepus didactylus TaxID=27675 RepID=UPI00189E3C61|nr:spidroin-1-like [Choloepus didactylus]